MYNVRRLSNIRWHRRVKGTQVATWRVAEAPERERERELVTRWRAGEFTGRWLATTGGTELCVLFAGRPGGPAGPDFRDAVLLRRDGSRVRGDVELHLRAQGWRRHGHDRDPRYNQVALHVVRQAEGARATPLASGAMVPLVEVTASGARQMPLAGAVAAAVAWPCAGIAGRRGASGMRAVLVAAGQARFAEHAAALAAACEARAARWARASEPHTPGWEPLDATLFVALAEGLAYGRERTALRAAGEWLAAGGAPDTLTRELPRLPRLDATRLEGLLTLFARWQATGPWRPLRAALERRPDAAALDALARALMVPRGLVSRGRAAILAVNVVLPGAAAWAERQGELALAERARALYAAYGGLPSNQITREMARQLGLARQPSGACAQQGLQQVWARWCREKRCEACPCGAV